MKEHCLSILLVDDDESVRHVLADFIRGRGHHVMEVGEGTTALQLVEKMHFHLVFIDIQMPGLDGISAMAKMKLNKPELNVVIFTGYGTMELAIRSFQLGALDFLQKPVNYETLENVINRVVTVLAEGDNQSKRGKAADTTVFPEYRFVNHHLIGTSDIIKDIRKNIDLIVSTQCDTVIIKGETGSGKEVVAHEIHYAATGNNAPFIAVSCPAIADTLIESELFGHTKGSFTGATTDRIGYFELAANGTLFLDEIADLSWVAQAKLLRVIETRRFRPLGSPREKSINLRLIAATNKSLEDLTHTGHFRPDLYYRLEVYSITVPPLREHPQDIIPLAEHFAAMYAGTRNQPMKSFSPPATDRLQDYAYPGNVRELKNVVERAIMVCQDPIIQAHDIIFDQDRNVMGAEHKLNEAELRERERIEQVLEQSRWNRKDAARILAMPYSTLRHKIKKFHIDR